MKKRNKKKTRRQGEQKFQNNCKSYTADTIDDLREKFANMDPESKKQIIEMAREKMRTDPAYTAGINQVMGSLFDENTELNDND